MWRTLIQWTYSYRWQFQSKLTNTITSSSNTVGISLAYQKRSQSWKNIYSKRPQNPWVRYKVIIFRNIKSSLILSLGSVLKPIHVLCAWVLTTVAWMLSFPAPPSWPHVELYSLGAAIQSLQLCLNQRSLAHGNILYLDVNQGIETGLESGTGGPTRDAWMVPEQTWKGVDSTAHPPLPNLDGPNLGLNKPEIESVGQGMPRLWGVGKGG